MSFNKAPSEDEDSSSEEDSDSEDSDDGMTGFPSQPMVSNFQRPAKAEVAPQGYYDLEQPQYKSKYILS